MSEYGIVGRELCGVELSELTMAQNLGLVEIVFRGGQVKAIED